MAAYAAAVSLMHIIDLLKSHPSPPISFEKQQLDSLTEIVTFLQEFLESYVSPFSYSDEADPLEMRIAEVIYAAEDVIESYIVDNIHLAASGINDIDYQMFLAVHGSDSRDGATYRARLGGRPAATKHKDDDVDGIKLAAAATTKDGDMDSIKLVAAAAAQDDDEHIRYFNFYEGLQKVIEAMGLIKKEPMEMEMETENDGLLEAELQGDVSIDVGFRSSSTEMVGSEDVRLELLDRLTGGDSSRQIIPIVGMGGIGKTTLARNVFDDKLIKEHFDICLWATISQDHDVEQILSKFMSQGTGNSGVAGLGENLHKYLFGRRYLVVMDDMWSIEVWDKMRFFFPDCGKGSRVIVTTRMSNLATHLSNSCNSLCMSFLNNVDSWTLFSKTVFADGESFSNHERELKEIGEEIVEKCQGLPLSIVVIGGLLAKSERTQGYWKYIEKNLSSTVILDNEEYCLRILTLSYNHLPAYLKPCFLYMGVFNEDSEIKVSKIIRLWVSEGFIKPKKEKKRLEMVAREYFQELVDRNLVLALADDEWADPKLGLVGNSTKLCKMHDLVRDLSLIEAQKQRFYHVYGNEYDPGSHPHRRIVITNKNYFGVELKSSPNLRSYVCHDSRVGKNLSFRLLRTLDSQLCEYRHKDVFGLVNLRLLAIKVMKPSDMHPMVKWMCRVLHPSISRLWSLHTLIVFSEGYLNGPVELWNMHQLKHVEFIDGRLCLNPPPKDNNNNIVILENLQTLMGMRDFYLNEDVVKRIPNLTVFDVTYKKKLVKRNVHCLSYLQRLSKLESFRCRIYGRSGGNLERICFPQSLKQIFLIDFCNHEWDGVLAKIGRLPFVEDLVIGNGFFRGKEWETTEGQFPRLRRLELAGCKDLERWIVPEASHFPVLEKIFLEGLDELEEIPSEIGEIATLESILLSACSRSAMLSAKKIVEEREDLYGGEELSFRVRVVVWRDCWDEKLQSLATPNFQVERIAY